MPKPIVTSATIEHRLEILCGDLIVLAPDQTYVSMLSPLVFVDRDYGSFTTSPNNVLNKGCVHPSRKLEKRRRTNLEKYGVDNLFKDTARMQEAMLAKHGATHPSLSSKLLAEKSARCLKQYGVTSTLARADIKEKIDKTNLERYGGSPLVSPLIREKVKATLLERFGVDNALKSDKIKEKVKATNIERYGGNAPISDERVAGKMRVTLTELYGENYKEVVSDLSRKAVLEKYGVETVFSLPEIQEKITASNLVKYGVEHPLQNGDILKKMTDTNLKRHGVKFIGEKTFVDGSLEREKIRKTCEERYGYKFVLLTNGLYLGAYLKLHKRTDLNYTSCKYVFLTYGFEALREYVEEGKDFGSITSLERQASKLLGLEPCFKVLKNRKRPDFELRPDLYLDIDGLFWHSSYVLKDPYHHFNKRLKYEESGLRLLQIRDNELVLKPGIVKSLTENALGRSEKIYGRQCTVADVSWGDASRFLTDNHLQGVGPPSTSVGLYHGGNLVMLIAVRKKKEGVEIARLCSLNGKIVVGGFSRLLAVVKKRWNPAFVESWCDLRYATGKGYEKVGFAKVKDILSWSWTDFQEVYNRLRCRANMDDRALAEAEHAADLGWVKIYDAGQRLYRLNVSLEA